LEFRRYESRYLSSYALALTRSSRRTLGRVGFCRALSVAAFARGHGRGRKRSCQTVPKSESRGVVPLYPSSPIALAGQSGAAERDDPWPPRWRARAAVLRLRRRLRRRPRPRRAQAQPVEEVGAGGAQQVTMTPSLFSALWRCAWLALFSAGTQTFALFTHTERTPAPPYRTITIDTCGGRKGRWARSLRRDDFNHHSLIVQPDRGCLTAPKTIRSQGCLFPERRPHCNRVYPGPCDWGLWRCTLVRSSGL
jgi:hypothetical protein